MPVPLSRLFSLDLLKSFVAVGRRQSITQAAEDLNLTQSAVSRQVQALEDQLNAKLFERKHRGVAFTAQGERLFRTADQALQQLQQAAAEIHPGEVQRAVTVTASIGVMSLWLLPRLGQLQQQHPQLDVRLLTSNRVSDLRAEGVDLALRYCRDSAAPLHATRLFDESLAPVAHPSLLKAAEQAAQANPFDTWPLLEFDDSRPWLQWARWLGDSRWKKAQRRGVLRFNQYDQVIQAALAGQGMALGRLELIEPLIANGQLAIVDMPCTPQRSPNSYWLVQSDDAPRQDVLLVAAWVQAEADRVRQRGAAMGGRLKP